MIYIVQFFGLVMILLGLALLIRPDGVINTVNANLETAGLHWSAVIVRLVLGGALIAVAPRSAFTVTFYVLGALSLAAAQAILVMARERMISILKWGLNLGAKFARPVGLLARLLGGFLICAVI